MQLRLEHHICGFFVGTLPQAPQQNIFLGLPLELIPEEVAWLVDQGHAYIVDDKLRHQLYIENVTPKDVLSIKEKRITDIKRQNIEYKQNLLEKEFSTSFLKDSSNLDSIVSSLDNNDTEDDIPRNIIVPTKSKKSLYAMPIELSPKVKVDPSRYSVWKYLHDKGYYMTPGLKFGAHYLAYPGDPLKYHSHFLVNVMQWEQEFSIINIVGGGRLGTNVKKAWVIGANNPNTNIAHVFTVEWTGFG
ncbi:tRNA-intron endonuclease [Pneumocystis carinii B80]|uniref:tRNA-splicing endonuclease subunit Sen34 n=1 Tax=Pneumocystis carinii (strain B80) TaxID=1408658 RepID=A0A0W4ZR40_PNEC8|nr:tRNA-intron endonuclease [Pneumocystis carinii B80]KTW30833.1 tRNA-intron endonuclease [Pneumocystis carinii B80]